MADLDWHTHIFVKRCLRALAGLPADSPFFLASTDSVRNALTASGESRVCSRYFEIGWRFKSAPAAQSNLFYLEARFLLGFAWLLKIDEQSPVDSKEFHVIPKLLLFRCAHFTANRFQLDNHFFWTEPHDQVGISLANTVVLVLQFDYLLTFVGYLRGPQTLNDRVERP